MLANFIRHDDKIKRIKILFADNLTLFLRDKLSFYRLMSILEQFSKFSGLRVNNDKTEVLNLGLENKVTSKDLTIKQIKPEIKILGIFFLHTIKICSKN